MSDFTGKGSKQRPFDKEKFDNEFDRIFGKKDKEKCKKKNSAKSSK